MSLARFKVKRNGTEHEVDTNSIVYERVKKLPDEYIMLQEIEKEPEKPAIIDGDVKVDPFEGTKKKVK